MTERSYTTTRTPLARTYNLKRRKSTDELVVTNWDDAMRLIDDSLHSAATALIDQYASTHYSSDDGTDYLNAISDQISTLIDIRNCDINEDGITALNDIINHDCTKGDWNTQDCDRIDAHCFAYGYADHYSPISDLTPINYATDERI